MVKRPPLWYWCPLAVDRPPRPRVSVLPRHWVIKRTFAWLGRYRRMSNDNEVVPDTQRTMIYLMRQRLAVCSLFRHPLGRLIASVSPIVGPLTASIPS